MELIHQLGFDGKSIINPRQIKTVHEIYTPSEKEIAKAQAVMEAIEEARRKGSGVISLNGKMVDRPIVLRAQRVLALARGRNWGRAWKSVGWPGPGEERQSME